MTVAESPVGSQDVFQGGGRVGADMRDFDWAATPLGPPARWPRSLQSIVRMMLTSRYQMWMAWGPDLTFFCNDAYRPTLGVKYPWAIGRPAPTVWAEIWPDVGPLIDHVLTTGEATYSEGMLLILERSGFKEETYHTFSYSPLFDDAGAIAGMFCVVMEETERVINERRLGTLRKVASAAATTTSEDALFRAIAVQLAENAYDLPFTLSYLFDDGAASARLAAQSGIAAGDPGAARSLTISDTPWPIAPILEGATSAVVEGLGSRFANLPFGAWDRPPERALIVPLAQQAHEKAAAGFLVVGLNPYRPFDASYEDFLHLLAGQIAAALATARAYEEERKRAEALAEIDRAKTAFFSNVSHEFRTPLTLMLGPLEDVLAQPAEGNAALRSQVELAHRNGVRLLRLVNSLLDFSRIEAGRVQANFVPTDLSAFSAEIASSFRSAMEKAGLDFTIQAPPLSAPVYLDRDMWEKILLNLLSNAFKFTFHGGVSVEIGQSADGNFAELRVRDSGIGVAADELPRLFERFHRIEGAKGRTFEGSGIGLALVQELVKLHAGTIAAESEPGRGTTFTVRLSFGTAHLSGEFVHRQAAPSRSGNASAYVEEAMRWLPEPADIAGQAGTAPIAGAELAGDDMPGAGSRVLLADDNADMREYVQRLLAAQGYAVQTVGNGEAALAAVRTSAPDLILSDVMMPGLDGFGLLRAIRGEPALASIPVILLSARAGEEAKIEGLDAGADDYLIKPFAARELLARVSANIQMARTRRDAARAVMRSEQRYLMTNERLGLALSTGRIAVFELDIESGRATVLGPLTQFFGVSEADAAGGVPLSDFIDGIDPDDRERVMGLINSAIENGTPYEAEYRVIGGDIPRRVVARGGVLDGADGRRFSGVVIDITYEKETEDALRERTAALQTLNRTGETVAGELDLERVVQTVTDAGVALTGAEYGAFFYNVQDESGERYMLYSLSGAPRDAFAKFPMPRNTGLFAPTFSGEGTVRSDDITQDPRYGRNAPRHGMPEGHLPVRSYLAVPVKSRSGEVLGGLFFGHSEVAKFTDRAEEIMTGLAAQAAVAIDNARLFAAAQLEIAQRRRAEEELQLLNTGLEERVASEVAERMKAEDALRQAQKMEAVGQLTGGVAHDFNNLLTIIIGGLDIARRNASAESTRLTRGVEMAMQGARRAATLTERLLAFSRRQPLAPKPLDLNAVVRDSTELLHRTLGETIELEAVLTPRLWPVEVDQNQLESAILNLAVNARDAMPDGGKLTIETGNTMLDESYTAIDSEVIPGQYAVLSISDSGMGMPKEVVQRVFEPFYTTKEVGKGTGLGLSMVYGFVKQSGGHVTIYSEVGQGTTVKLYFPRFRGDTSAIESVGEIGVVQGRRDEIVLVVEDNDEVRSYSTMVLGELGYGVLEAENAEAALKIVRRQGRIDLLFTDVVLPGKTGRVLADEAQAIRPGLKVLFTTGYSRNAIVHQGRLDPGVQLITKPFTFEQLAARIRDVLDG
jgi:signal transduction histidine kinase/DNA-binding response OmpR family regulator